MPVKIIGKDNPLKKPALKKAEVTVQLVASLLRRMQIVVFYN